MSAMKTISGALLAIAATLAGCAMTPPLETESFVLLRFESPSLPPDKNFLGVDRNMLYWDFAVANESTGWNFHLLDYFSMIFRTHGDGLWPNANRITASASGWVIFLAPRGLSYLSVTNYTMFDPGGQRMVATPFPDHISVAPAQDLDMPDLPMGIRMEMRIDFTDSPRFAVQVSEPRSLIYAGTIVRNNRCGIMRDSLAACPYDYDLTVVDESELAKRFVSRYPEGFSGAAPMRTQLLTIPQTRTIEIRGGAAGGGH